MRSVAAPSCLPKGVYVFARVWRFAPQPRASRARRRGGFACIVSVRMSHGESQVSKDKRPRHGPVRPDTVIKIREAQTHQAIIDLTKSKAGQLAYAHKESSRRLIYHISHTYISDDGHSAMSEKRKLNWISTEEAKEEQKVEEERRQTRNWKKISWVGKPSSPPRSVLRRLQRNQARPEGHQFNCEGISIQSPPRTARIKCSRISKRKKAGIDYIQLHIYRYT